MKFLLALIDSILNFVQRNPLTVLVILILAIGAPYLLWDIARIVFYIFAGFALVVVALMLTFGWRIYKLHRQMKQGFGAGFDPRNGFSNPYGEPQQPQREGEVKIHKTPDTPEKRVSKNVGDYVEFEEEKES